MAHVAVVVAVLLGIIVLGLVGAVGVLGVRLRRVREEERRRGAVKSYQEEFEWGVERGEGGMEGKEKEKEVV